MSLGGLLELFCLVSINRELREMNERQALALEQQDADMRAAVDNYNDAVAEFKQTVRDHAPSEGIIIDEVPIPVEPTDWRLPRAETRQLPRPTFPLLPHMPDC